MFWRKCWQELGLSHILRQQMSTRTPPLQLAVEKYVDMMVLNPCIRPASKLRTSKWVDTTSYKVMHGYACPDRDVNDFYRRMEYLLEMKDAGVKYLDDMLRWYIVCPVGTTCPRLMSRSQP